MGGLLAFVAGLQMPVGDSDWTKYVDVSPKLGARAEVIQGPLAGILSLDFTPEQIAPQTAMPLGFDTGASGYRFRILAHLGVEHELMPKLTVTGRIGAGLDLAHGSYDYTLAGGHFSSSDTDLGYAIEFGAGLWWDLGGTQVGGELALPISHHDKPSENGSVAFTYTSYDLDLLVGVRWLR